MTDIRTYLETDILLFDGGMGTWWAQQNRDADFKCELANLFRPESVRSIHDAYLDAGARAIKTNTFGLNAPALGGERKLLRDAISAGWDIASQAAAGREAYVFADIGPVLQSVEEGPLPYFREVADIFLEKGARHFLFETNSSIQGIPEAASYIRAQVPDAFIMVSFAVQPDGYTREGFRGSALLQEAAAYPDIDAVGMNCVSGAYHMRQLLKGVDLPETFISAMPNAGYPVVAGNRTLYDGDPGYYAVQLAELAELNVKILGGCCGTTPEHIARAAAELKRVKRGVRKIRIAPAERKPNDEAGFKKPRPNHLWEKMERGEKVFAIELDPPKNAQVGKFMSGAWILKDAGADAITIADCPIGRARMDSSILACKLRREVGIDPIPHMTCRDRNLNATKSLLLGLNVEGVDNVLIVTGDPLPTAERDEVKTVYNFNSRKLAHFVSDLNETQLDNPFRVYGALNLNARNFDVELKRAKEKAAYGISGFLTQPVLTEKAFENLRLSRSAMPDVKILGGIIPVVSYRNACFMQSEIAGINVSDEIIELYKDKDRDESEALALRISAEIGRRITPYVDGYYMMTPFLRVHLMVKIMEEIRKSLPEDVN